MQQKSNYCKTQAYALTKQSIIIRLCLYRHFSDRHNQKNRTPRTGSFTAVSVNPIINNKGTARRAVPLSDLLSNQSVFHSNVYAYAVSSSVAFYVIADRYSLELAVCRICSYGNFALSSGSYSEEVFGVLDIRFEGCGSV